MNQAKLTYHEKKKQYFIEEYEKIKQEALQESVRNSC